MTTLSTLRNTQRAFSGRRMHWVTSKTLSDSDSTPQALREKVASYILASELLLPRGGF